MNKSALPKILYVIAAAAFVFEVVRRYVATGLVVDAVAWAALGAFAFWKMKQSPRLWGLYVGSFVLLAIVVQTINVARYLNSKGDAGLLHALSVTASPLLIVTVCCFWLSRISPREESK